MSGALVTNTNDFFYMNLSYVNDTDTDQPCRIVMQDDMTIIDDPSKYMFGVLSFGASLGASSLIFSRSDAEQGLIRRVTYAQNFNDDGDFGLDW